MLHIAVGNDEPEMIKFLLSLSATIVNIECKNMVRNNFNYDEIISYCFYLKQSGHTPLIYAVDIKARNSIPLLLESGADPNMAGVVRII